MVVCVVRLLNICVCFCLNSLSGVTITWFSWLGVVGLHFCLDFGCVLFCVLLLCFYLLLGLIVG